MYKFMSSSNIVAAAVTVGGGATCKQARKFAAVFVALRSPIEYGVEDLSSAV